MLSRSAAAHLLIDSEKFGRKGLARVGGLEELDSVVVDERPRADLASALNGASVEIMRSD
jgi:DeoR/GlpR family transcriptional regulator of sugar metabolism